MIKQSTLFKSSTILSSILSASINFTFLIFFSKIFDKWVFPEPAAPKISYNEKKQK
jgi:hypothetical protein